MNRRSVLSTTGISLSISLAGCLNDVIGGGNNSSETGDPDVSAADLEVSAGESATLSVEVTETAGVQIVPDSESDAIEFDFAEAILTPDPTFTYSMRPPFWRWESRSAVELKLPVAVADDADPHEYRYGVRVIAEEPGSESADEPEGNETPNVDEMETQTEEFQILITE